MDSYPTLLAIAFLPVNLKSHKLHNAIPGTVYFVKSMVSKRLGNYIKMLNVQRRIRLNHNIPMQYMPQFLNNIRLRFP